MELLDRGFLQELREAANEAADTEGMSPDWRGAYKDLAHAANVLDAFWARCEVLEDEEMDIEVELAEEGTIMAEFQKERTDAISEMFDGPDVNGIYPTSRFFARLDIAVEKALSRQKESLVET